MRVAGPLLRLDWTCRVFVRPKCARSPPWQMGGEWVEEYVSEDGEKLYQSLCSGCHMADGSGAVGARKYPALIGNPNLEFAG